MLRLLPLLLVLTACAGTNYSDHEAAKEFCRDTGLEGEAQARCIARREHEAACRRLLDSRESSVAEARRRGCD